MATRGRCGFEEEVESSDVPEDGDSSRDKVQWTFMFPGSSSAGLGVRLSTGLRGD